MANNENYIGNYSPSSSQFLHQDSPLNVDLSNHLDLPSVRKAHEWLQVFPISIECGVNLQTPILEFDPDDIVWHPILSTYAKRTDVNKKEFPIVFIIKMCTCERCRNPEKMIDVMQVEPFRTVVKLCKDAHFSEITLTFYPVVTSASDFNMRKDVTQCSPSKLVFFCNILVLPSRQLIPFRNYSAILHRLINSPEDEESLRLEHKKSVSSHVKEEIVTRNGQKLPYNGIMLLVRDLMIESSDKKRMSCYSPVLIAQGYKFKMTAGNQKVDKKGLQVVEVPENSIIIDLFLKWIYRQDDELLKSQKFEVLIRILNLACQFQILKLMGTISKLLMEEMDRDGFLWKDEDMWRLYCVTRTVNEIQIVVRLKEKIRGKVQILKQQRKKHGSTKTTKFEQDGNAACTAYMDQVFFKILIDLIEKDGGEKVAATVKIL